jgi:hypothetical protein
MPNQSTKRHKSTEKSDVAADNPEGTMERFAVGLKRVLNAPKIQQKPKKRTSFT